MFVPVKAMRDVVVIYKENTGIIVDTFTSLGFNVMAPRMLLICGCISSAVIHGMCLSRSLRRRMWLLLLVVDLHLVLKGL
jgi:hypothetical protein